MNVGEDAPDSVGEVHMFCETEFMRGGTIFGRCNGGTLYEKASKGEKIVLDSVANAFMYPPSTGWPVKRSIEAKRTFKGKATRNFLCEGTMVRHTLKSWGAAPCDPHGPHAIEASESEPTTIFFRRFLVEDLLPFSRDEYWVTVWRKCEACQAKDDAFKEWAMAAPGEESRTRAISHERGGA